VAGAGAAERHHEEEDPRGSHPPSVPARAVPVVAKACWLLPCTGSPSMDSLDGHGRLAVTLSVNGAEQPLVLEPRRTLLDALRDELALTGTKKVCDMGDCGACTVLLDGRAVYACLRLAVDCVGGRITTIEGLGGERLDAVQEAFIRADAFQCGFCTPGQIMSLRALLDATGTPSDEEILRAVTGNLCRCGAYPRIEEAISSWRG